MEDDLFAVFVCPKEFKATRHVKYVANFILLNFCPLEHKSDICLPFTKFKNSKSVAQ